MTTHSVLIPEAIMATNIDSLNRNVVDAADIDNGMVFASGSIPHTSGSMAEVWDIHVAATSASGLWMAYSGDEVVVTNAQYKGLDPDPRNFYNAAGKVFSAYKPQVGDMILLTAAGLQGTFSAGTTTHVVASSGSWVMGWATTANGSALSYILQTVKYISLATGAIDSQRVTAYEFECVHN